MNGQSESVNVHSPSMNGLGFSFFRGNWFLGLKGSDFLIVLRVFVFLGFLGFYRFTVLNPKTLNPIDINEW
jgi:hypothetical protein